MNIPSPLEKLNHPFLRGYGVEVWMKRDDLIHPVVSGNKFRKLKYILGEYRESNKYKGIVSFGGAFSNHIHALSGMCFDEHIPCTVLVRSRGGIAVRNPTLDDILKWGTQVVYIPSEEYRLRYDTAYLNRIQSRFPGYWIIPEGGSHPLALKGMAEVLEESRQIHPFFDHIFTPVGTGATLAGLAISRKEGEKIWGISALKSMDFGGRILDEWALGGQSGIGVFTQWHWGGYGKTPDRLLRFLSDFESDTGIGLDPLYNGKAMYALWEYIRCGLVRSDSTVFFLHTGGLQGWRGK